MLQLVQQRGWTVVEEYLDTISGVRSRRPGLDRLMNDARRGRFEVVVVWAFDRLARSVRHFLQVIDELRHLNVEFVSYRENIDTTRPLGQAILVILSGRLPAPFYLVESMQLRSRKIAVPNVYL